MRLDELFSRKSGVSVWTKTGGNLIVDHGEDGFGLRTGKLVNKLVARKEDDQEENS
jgi:hypothetical protein